MDEKQEGFICPREAQERFGISQAYIRYLMRHKIVDIGIAVPPLKGKKAYRFLVSPYKLELALKGGMIEE